jgi:hypothetical protein
MVSGLPLVKAVSSWDTDTRHNSLTPLLLLPRRTGHRHLLSLPRPQLGLLDTPLAENGDWGLPLVKGVSSRATGTPHKPFLHGAVGAHPPKRSFAWPYLRRSERIRVDKKGNVVITSRPKGQATPLLCPKSIGR